MRKRLIPLLIAGLLFISAARAAEPTDEDRQFMLQAYTMMAVRVIEPEQQVMATNDQCRERGMGGASLQAAFSDWTKRNRALYRRAHMVLSQPFMDRVVGARLGATAGMKSQSQIRSLLVAHNYDEARAWLNARKLDDLGARCSEFEKALRSGKFDYRQQQPDAFRIIERIDLEKPLAYTADKLLALGKR
jgi:hypothetical protein